MNPAAPKLVLDWKAYYEAFRKLHGDHPVIFRGRQLFPDGWTYSQKDYRGPEWPPPEKPEELLELQLFYWRRRRAIVTQELHALKTTMESLVQAQSGRSAPLHHRVTLRHLGEEGQAITQRKSQPVKMDWFKGRLLWLSLDLDNCSQQLLLLEEQLKTLEGRGDTHGKETNHQQSAQR